MRNSKYNLIRKIFKSIKNSKIISLTYQEGGPRYVEPYLYLCKSYKDKEDEKLKKIRFLLAYQIGGYSSSDQDVGWKLFKISNILSVSNDLHYPKFDKRPVNLENSPFKKFKIVKGWKTMKTYDWFALIASLLIATLYYFVLKPFVLSLFR